MQPPPNDLGCRGRAPTGNASHALARSRPTAHIDHLGRLGVGAGHAHAQPPFSANSEGSGKIDDAGFRWRGPRRHSRAMLQVSDHQAP